MMTLEQVRDELIKEAEWYESRLGDYKTPDFRAMADAIDFHLSQPQAVAPGEAVAFISHFQDRLSHMQMTEAGLCLGIGKHPCYATPTIPTGQRVVPVEPSEEMVLAAAKSVSDEWDDESADVKTGLLEIQRAALRDAVAASPSAGGV